MSAEAEVLRGGIAERRERLASLQRDEATAATECEELEARLAEQRQRREVLGRQTREVEEEIAALEGAVAILAERMPARASVSATTGELVPVEPKPAPRARSPRREVAHRILQEAEELDLSALSQRSRERAEHVVRVMARSGEEHVQHEDLVAALYEARRDVFPTEAKARTAVEVGIPILLREGRVRCVNSVGEVWALTPPERASGGLGARIADFEGRTTDWKGPRSPKSGTLIRRESGSYEGGKRR